MWLQNTSVKGALPSRRPILTPCATDQRASDVTDAREFSPVTKGKKVAPAQHPAHEPDVFLSGCGLVVQHAHIIGVPAQRQRWTSNFAPAVEQHQLRDRPARSGEHVRRGVTPVIRWCDACLQRQQRVAFTCGARDLSSIAVVHVTLHKL